MIRKCAVAVPFLGALVCVAGTISWAAQSHTDEAVKHAQEAITYGKQGNADQLVNHAETALKHAEAAQMEKANPHIAEGIKGLKDTIEHAKQGHADTATNAAEGALKHFLDVKDAPLDKKADGGGTARPPQEGPPRGLDSSGGY
jgi:hypothetical protein